MTYKKFTVNVVIRVTLILVTCLFLAKEIYSLQYIILLVNLPIFLIIQVYLLIDYINKVNSRILLFFDHIKSKDTSLSFQKRTKTNTFTSLDNRMDETIKAFKEINIEKEAKETYLKYIANHLETGIITFFDNGQLDFINDAALSLLNISNHIHNIKEIKTKNQFFNNLLSSSISENEIIELENSNKKLAYAIGEIKIKDEKINVLSLQDIEKQLDNKEIESWSKLIRILNHEIMNSITPITSLSNTMKRYFKQEGNLITHEQVSSKLISNTYEGLDIIEERGNGLINFVNNYRKLSSLPKPEFSECSILNIFNSTISLLSNELESNSIICKANVGPIDLKIWVDKSQIQQLLINLLQNSIRALQGNKKAEIKLDAHLIDENKVLIQVTDNGKGIPKDIIGDVFTPFYTTEEKGSGIGLSISKQIIKNHNGTISISSLQNIETNCTIILPYESNRG